MAKTFEAATRSLRTQRSAGWRDYLALARLDPANAGLLLLPGMFLAMALQGVRSDTVILTALLGAVAAFAVGLGNRVLDEFLDRESDRYRPVPSARAARWREMSTSVVIGAWLALLATGLFAAAAVSDAMLAATGLLALQGVAHSVPPIRAKDIAYADMLSGAAAAPLTLMIGWTIVDPATLPPVAAVLACWFGAAAVIGAKRLREYRRIVSARQLPLLARFRRSFAGCSARALTRITLAYLVLGASALTLLVVSAA